MQELHWQWGIYNNEPLWYVKVSMLDTDLYAMASFSLDDSNPQRIYQSNNPDLLSLVISIEETEMFEECRTRKNYLIDAEEAFENATVANFM